MTGEVFAKGPTVIEPNNVGGTDKDRSLDRVTPPRDETLNELEASGQTDDFSKSSKPANAPAVSASTMVGVPAAVTLPPTEDPNAIFVAPPTEDPNATFVAPPTEDPNATFVAPRGGDPNVAFVVASADPNATVQVPSGELNATVHGHKGSGGAGGDKSSVVVTDLIKGYYILGELGRGGMGVVYRARQIALNRVVAIKMILAGGHAGSEQLARFQAEAEAVAMLAHPNIVQVYDIGEQDGLPYFSLEFVDGTGLDRELGGKPQPEKKSAQLIEILARAMQFAHEHGIIHRDLKPANVLVTKNGVPKISDFGLAKQLDTDSSQTRTGTIMGTPSYMAPEQGRGEKVGPLADVYSLGSMLYEMITGRPPFVAATAVQTLMRLLKEEPVLPSRVQPHVSRDLETICLKCLQKDPHTRYASAAALADDLRRFQAGEPILARPVSAPERLWRWCKRNPKIASLTAAVLMLLMTVATVSTVMAFRIQKEKLLVVGERNRANNLAKLEASARTRAEENANAARIAQQEAEQARTVADENAKVAGEQAGLALTTMQTLIDKVQNQLEDVPRTQKLKRELLETAMAGLKEVAKKAEGSTSIEATMLAAHMRMGHMFRQLGATEEAMKEFVRCQEIAKRRATEKPNNDAAQGNLAAVLTVLGDMNQELRRDMVAALECYQQALAIREKLHAKPPSAEGALSPESVKQALAEAHTRVGVTVLRLGDPPESLPSFEKALVLRRELSDAHPEVEALKQDLARSNNAVGEVSFLSGNAAEARKYYDECLELRDAMLKAKPESVRFKMELANTCGNYGDLCLRSRDNDAAKTHYDRAFTLSQDLADLDDQNVDYQRGLGMAFYRLGALAQRVGDEPAATKHFRQCLEIREKLAAADQKNEVRQMELMLALAHCGEHARAAQIAAEVRAGKSKDRELLFEVARCYAQCAAAAAADNKLGETYADQAVEALSEAVAQGYHDVVAFETEPDLDPVRGHAGYEALLAKFSRR